MRQEFNPFPLTPFCAEQESGNFGTALMKKVLSEQERLRSEFMPRENIQVFAHGRTWNFKQKTEEGFMPEKGEFKRQSSGFQIHDQRFLANDLTLVDELISRLATSMAEGMRARMMNEFSEVCERNGRVDTIMKAEWASTALLRALEDIEYGVDADGKVSQPFLQLNDELRERLNYEILIRGDAIKQESEESRKRVEEQALEREANRKSKFQRP